MRRKTRDRLAFQLFRAAKASRRLETKCVLPQLNLILLQERSALGRLRNVGPRTLA